VIQGTVKPIDAGKINDQLYVNCIGVGFDGELIYAKKVAVKVLEKQFNFRY
jgi:diacylglycerol kinase family enzyme